MPLEIGTTLRETRVRRKIDITTVEDAIKIRAKFLRALEDEEWEILPDDAYVRSFLRTYAEYLGLDAQLIVDEYGYRIPSEKAEGGYSEALSGGRERGGRAPERRPLGAEPRGSRRVWIVAGLAIALIALLLLLGLTADTTGAAAVTVAV